MILQEIQSVDDARVAVYAGLTERQLQNRKDPAAGLFICESPKVILTAMGAGYEPQSLLCERRHVEGDAREIIARAPQRMPVYVGERGVLERLTGYTLTRGVLCAMRRPALPAVEDVVRHARRVAVLDAVVDATNVGAIFRSAAALGVDAVLLTPQSCDTLNRRAVRVSMGSVFLLPWTRLEAADGLSPIRRLHALGFETAATALTDRSITLDDLARQAPPRLAIFLGGEGYGLAPEVISEATHVVRIPMCHGVDSLNVGAAAAVTFYALRAQD